MNNLTKPIHIGNLIHEYQIEKEYEFGITFPNVKYPKLCIDSIFNGKMIYADIHHFIESKRDFKHYYYDYTTNKWTDDSSILDWIVKFIS